jgi:hypothetical protein
MSKKRKDEYLVDTTEGKDMKKGFTLNLLFSRMQCVTPFFNAFSKMRIPLDDCHLIIFDNTDKAPLGEMLKEIAEDLKDRFYTVRCIKTYREGAKVLQTDPNPVFKRTKLPPIYAAYRQLTRLVTTKHFINIEDDTICPPHTVMRLLSHLNKYGEDIFVSGIEPDRGPDWSSKVRLGVHYIHRMGNLMLQRVSLSPKCKGVKEVDATGHYCFITSKKVWKDGWKDMDKYVNEIPLFALDMFHTNNIKNKGFPLLADFRIQCFHIHPTPEKTLYWSYKKAVSKMDYYIPQYKIWAQAIELKEDVMDRPEFEKWLVPAKICLKCLDKKVYEKYKKQLGSSI